MAELSNTKKKDEFPYIKTREDKQAVARIKKVWKAYSDQLLWDLKDKFNDKYNADDCITEEQVKYLVLGCVKRWLWEDLHALGGEDAVVEGFCNDAFSIAGRGIGGDDFEKLIDPPMMRKLLNWKPKKPRPRHPVRGKK